MEIKYQKTVGKLVTNTRVVDLNGDKPDEGKIIARTFFRLIPFDRILFVFTKNGIHDYFKWSVNRNKEVIAQGAEGGHITSIDYFQLSWMIQRVGLKVEEVKANVESRPKGLKGIPFKFVEALSQLGQNTYPSILELGSGLILKIRKPTGDKF